MAAGFWAYRYSHDMIFVVNHGYRDAVINEFGKFLNALMGESGSACKRIRLSGGPGSERIQRDEYEDDPSEIRADLTLNWRKLVSIEVQTKKTIEEKGNLHVKFYFEPDYIRGLVKDVFSETHFKQKIMATAKWANDDKPGSPDEVFDANTTFDEVVVRDSIFGNLDQLKNYALPRNKNIKIVTPGYQSALLSLNAIGKRNANVLRS
jgi:hypothetical protein